MKTNPMRIIKKVFKIVGLLILLTVLILSPFVGSLYFLNKELVTNSVEETVKKFGELKTDELIKSKEAGSGKLFIAGTMGQVLPKQFSFKSLKQVKMHSMIYKSDSLLVTGFMITPKKPGKYPCVIFNRGGNREFGRLNIMIATMLMAPIASEGYVVIASNYRGNGGSEGLEEFGGSDVNDILNLIPALGQVELADTSRVGMIGFSRGGMMTYQALKKYNKIKAAVVISGMSNLFQMKTDRPDMEQYVYSELIPNYQTNIDEELKERSAVYWVDELSETTPLLIFHGTADERVSYVEAKQLADSLKNYEHPFKFVTAQEDNHPLKTNIHKARSMSIQWFDDYLRDLKTFEEPEETIVLE